MREEQKELIVKKIVKITENAQNPLIQGKSAIDLLHEKVQHIVLLMDV